MNQSVSTYNSTLIGEGGGERIYGQQYLHIGLLSKTVCVPISFETDCSSYCGRGGGGEGRRGGGHWCLLETEK